MVSWVWEDEELRIMFVFLVEIIEWMVIVVFEMGEYRRSRFGGD